MTAVLDRPPVAPGPPAPWLGRAAVTTVMVVMMAYCLFPIVWLVIAATKNAPDLTGTNGFSFARFNLGANVSTLVSRDGGIYLRWFVNSLLYAGIGAVVSTLFCFLAGHAFDKFSFRGKEFLFGFVLVGVLVPSAVTALPLYLLASKLEIVNTFWAVLLPALPNPFGVYLARVFAGSYVPAELIEAGRLDGASESRVFFRIAMPSMWPGAVTLFLFSFNGIWNNFLLPLLMLTDQNLYPVALGLYYWNSQSATNADYYPSVITGSLIAIVPVVLLFIMLQRFWRAGLGTGAVK